MPDTELKQFCEKHHIKALSVFGSALRDDFSETSDVDFLVEFDSEAKVGLLQLVGMEDELTELIGYRGEIHTPEGLNPRFAEQVLSDAELFYEQA